MKSQIVAVLLVLLIAAAAFAQAPAFVSTPVGGLNYYPAQIVDLDSNGIADLVTLESIAVTPPIPSYDAVGVIWDVGTDPSRLQNPRTILLSTSTLINGVQPATFAAVRVLDQDGDADLDVVIFSSINGLGSAPYALFQTSPRAFAAPVEMQAATAAFTPNVSVPFAIGDFDGNGFTDVYVNYDNTGSGMLVSYGSVWLPMTFTPLLSNINGRVATGDFNGDGADDVCWRQAGPGGAIPPADILCIQPGSPILGASPLQTILIPTGTGAIDAADLNGDGRAEIILEVTAPAGLLVLSSPAQGAWPVALPVVPSSAGPNAILSAAPPAGAIRAVDLDGDGSFEVVKFLNTIFQNPATNTKTIEIQRNVGNGGVALAPWVALTLPAPMDLANPFVGDFDGDGDIDIVMVSVAPTTTVPINTMMTVIENRAIYGTAVSGSTGDPRFDASGIALGSASFSMNLAFARPNAFAALLLSANAVPAASGFLVDLSPSALYLLNGQIPGGITTALGQGTFSIPVPNAPALRGFSFAAQWAIIDPASAFAVGTVPVALTRARTMTIF